MEITVDQLMSDDVITLRESDDLGLAEEVMKLARLRHLPVVNASGELVGLITHRDLLRAQVSSFAQLSDEEDRALKRSLLAEQIMNTDVHTIGPSEPALSAALFMRTDKIGCLPVVDDGKLVGIITEADFLDLAIRALSPPEPQSADHAGHA